MNVAPLADRIRPQTLKEFVGQDHLVGKDGILKKLIESDQLVSLIFWGPPGCGKTTLARIIANTTDSHFVHFSAVTARLADVRQAIKSAKERLGTGEQLIIGVNPRATLPKSRPSDTARRTVLFLDEIHRFNKAQQDALLPHVEDGTIILIGATTENPSFEVISPLLSRCRVLVLNPLDLKTAGKILERGLKFLDIKIKPPARKFLLEASNGDARIVLNVLEIAYKLLSPSPSSTPQPDSKPTTHPHTISLDLIERAFQKKTLLYDQGGEEHYNTISAFIKSMRASDPDAALYYLARMIEAGEDPLFIARRMVIFASEDIGMAQPTALVVANEVFRACETIGYPECAINLAHGVVYLAKAPKNRDAYDGLRAAQKDVQKHGNLPIPLEILNAPTKLMSKLGYGKGYEPYPKNKSLLPKKLKGKKYYRESK